MMEAAWVRWEVTEGEKREPGVNIRNRFMKQGLALQKSAGPERSPHFSCPANQWGRRGLVQGVIPWVEKMVPVGEVGWEK